MIYDPQFHKLEEIWSDSTYKIKDVNKHLEELDDNRPRTRRNRHLKFLSVDASLKYKGEDEGEEDDDDEHDHDEVVPAQQKVSQKFDQENGENLPEIQKQPTTAETK